MATKEQKEIAVKRLREMAIFAPYVEEFEKNGTVTMFENAIGYWAYQYDDVMAKIKELEQTYGCLIYAVTHEFTAFGEMYDFFMVSKYREDWDHEFINYKNGDFIAFVYAQNKTDEMCSEMGTIGVKCRLGGIVRTD